MPAPRVREERYRAFLERARERALEQDDDRAPSAIATAATPANGYVPEAGETPVPVAPFSVCGHRETHQHDEVSSGDRERSDQD